MKRLAILALIMFLAVGLTACGGDSTETIGEIETVPTETTIAVETTVAIEETSETFEAVETIVTAPTEPEFVSDYKPGEENTRSFTRESFCIQQGEWLYYTTDGDKYNSEYAKTLLKFPIGGKNEDVQKVLSEDELSDNSISCDLCNGLVVDFKTLHAVLGDWVYIGTEDKHILRSRTDGTQVECIWCPEPEDLVKNAYVMSRDDCLYFTEETLKHLDASTLVSTYLLKKQDLGTGNITTVGEVDWNLQNFGRGSVVFQADGSFYACGEHQVVEIKSNDEINKYDYTFSFEQDNGDLSGYVFMPGVERSLVFHSNDDVYKPNGLYSLNNKDLSELPHDFIVPKSEYSPQGQDTPYLWSVWDPYLLAGSSDIAYYNGIIDVDDGYAYNSNSGEGLMYYSFVDQAVYKINNDNGEHLFWSEDEGLLYYQTSINGKSYLCRVKLDGSQWEDVSWMLSVPAADAQ